MVSLGNAVGDVDILINNAGDIPAGTVEALTDADWRRGFDLKLFGYINFDPKKASVRDAVRYLAETQDDDGSWYGRWGVNYIYGTWQVLRGLRAIGENMTQDWILRGRDWLESCQNPDGGWGETCASYDDPTTKGCGPSTASQTAWAVMGICACGDLDRPSVQRGLRYLLSTQRQDGTWDESRQTVTTTICPYCGVGCNLDLHVQDNRIVKVTSPLDHDVGHGHLCVKGRFGFEFVQRRRRELG